VYPLKELGAAALGADPIAFIMEWTVPLQTFDAGKLRLGGMGRGAKPMVPFSYQDGDLTFTHLALLLPPLPVKSYDAASGRLVLSLSGSATALGKLQALQDAALTAVRQHQRAWFAGAKPRDAEDLRGGFQPMVEHTSLHLYCPAGGSGSGSDFALWSKGEWLRGAAATAALVPGATVRFAIRVQGISFHQHAVSGVWTGKCRLQHRVLAAFAAAGPL
jgi:hypothetical protein